MIILVIILIILIIKIKTGNKCLSSFKNDEVTEIWGGKLSNDEYALLLVNRASITTKIEVSFEDLNLFDEKKVKLRDLWEKKVFGLYLGIDC